MFHTFHVGHPRTMAVASHVASHVPKGSRQGEISLESWTLFQQEMKFFGSRLSQILTDRPSGLCLPHRSVHLRPYSSPNSQVTFFRNQPAVFVVASHLDIINVLMPPSPPPPNCCRVTRATAGFLELPGVMS